MDVREAVRRRVSVRAFRPDPVPGAVVADILAEAARAPSGGNFQPWRVYALAGDALACFTRLVGEKFAAGIVEAPEYEVYPPKVWEPYRTRRREAGTPRYTALGNPEPTPELMRELQRRNYLFFGAPVGLFFCLDRRFGPPQWADIGMYMQTVMLLAAEQGLDTCPQEIWSNWPATIRTYLGLPEELMPFAGMALGYRDNTDPLCVTGTLREPLTGFAELRGFADQL